MKATIIAGFAAALLVPGTASPQDKPEKDPAAAKVEIKLKIVDMPSRAKPMMRLEGEAPFADGVIFDVLLERFVEQDGNGRIMRGVTPVSPCSAEVQGKRFKCRAGANGPGYYRVTMELTEDSQRVALKKHVKDMTGTKHWTFEFSAWTDDLVAKDLSPMLLEIDSLSNDLVELIKKFVTASATKAVWETVSKDLLKDAAKLNARIERSECQKLFPAAWNELRGTCLNLQTNAAYLIFDASGKLAGAFDYHTNGKAVTHRHDEFDFESLIKYAAEAVDMGGREFSLWVIKDWRRGGKAEVIAKAVKDASQHAGVSAYSARLTAGQELDPLEVQIRAAGGRPERKQGQPAAPPPPAPPQNADK